MFLNTSPFCCPSIRDIKGLCCDKSKISLLCNEMKVSRRINCQNSKKKEDLISSCEAINEDRGRVVKVNSDMGIGITSFFEGKNIFLTGATGLLGKVLVEKILRSTPIRKIYVLVKADDPEAAKDRLMKELVNSELFGCVQEKHGNYYQEFMKEKLIPVVGDICKPSLGMDCDSARAIMEDVNVIIGSAAITTLNERLIPLDVVVNTIIAAIAKHGNTQKSELNVYQLASGFVNPLRYSEFFEYIYEYFISKPLIECEGVKRINYYDNLTKIKYFDNFDDFSKHTRDEIFERNGVINGVVAPSKNQTKLVKQCKAMISYAEHLCQMYEFSGFFKASFHTGNTQKLLSKMSEEERMNFTVDVKEINWKKYFQEIHLPGLRKYVLDDRRISI